jgi:uncharacterized Zn-binding protein involved in type VI secretion
MPQFTNDLTPELLASFITPIFSEAEVAELDSQTRQQLLDRNSSPVTQIFRTATVGSRTRQGGEILAVCSQSVTVGGYFMAQVGDKVVYPDGSEAMIISGAGVANMIDGVPVAIVGSELDNGDEIVSTPQGSRLFCLREGDERPEGFLVPRWGMAS